MNWATTIDLNPVALLPSACIPHMPKVERREMLKMYGDAPVTLSASMTTFSPPPIVMTSSVASESIVYVNLRSLVIPETRKLPL